MKRKGINMNATRRVNISGKQVVDTAELQSLLSCGRKTAVEIGDHAGAKIKIGRRVLWNVNKVQQYLDNISK